MARLSLEERVSAVEQLRRTWFGEASARPQHLQESPPPCRNAPHHDGESLPPPRKRGLRHPQADRGFRRGDPPTVRTPRWATRASPRSTSPLGWTWTKGTTVRPCRQLVLHRRGRRQPSAVQEVVCRARCRGLGLRTHQQTEPAQNPSSVRALPTHTQHAL
jgi:hypothetical protein